ncbi:hypothetical protein PR048_005151 [Dryococelus australis]|uniref:Uncharacterized protein n=1 Tax=Dryococelus australis TaxID=614101 RepID=A0ABQ9I8J5_9NEOP|nr:hypothetical protein PR048_005151 [Dryococelus australis]
MKKPSQQSPGMIPKNCALRRIVVVADDKYDDITTPRPGGALGHSEVFLYGERKSAWQLDAILSLETPLSSLLERATVSERLACSPPTKANRVQSLAGSPDFRKWKSCRTMLLVSAFSRGTPVSPAPSFWRRSILTSITLIGSQDLTVKSRRNLFTHSLGLADADYIFIYIEVGSRGNQSDGGTFSESALYQCLDSNTFNMPSDEELPNSNRLSGVQYNNQLFEIHCPAAPTARKKQNDLFLQLPPRVAPLTPLRAAACVL